MTLLFYWTGLVFWLILGLAISSVLLAIVIFMSLAIISTLMQEWWVKRAGIKRNDVSFWTIVLQDWTDSVPEHLRRIWHNAKAAWNRTPPLTKKIGYAHLKEGPDGISPAEDTLRAKRMSQKLDDLPPEPQNRPMNIL